MKKILALCVLLSSLAFSQKAADDVERILTMHGLESAMSMVEKGFLRNNVTIVKLGTENLKVNLKNINSFLIEPSAKDKNFNAQTYAATESAAIAKLADEILANFEAGKNDDARASFDKTLSRCLACHRIIRKW